MCYLYSLWPCVLSLTALCGGGTADQHEYNLYRDLMQNYDPLERPTPNFSLPVVVKMKVVLQQIVGLDEKNQVIETNVWLQYEWHDYKLRWLPEEYNGVTDIRFPVGSLWKPDILLYNSADSDFDSTYKSNMIVYADGTISWLPPGILKSSCKVDITWFPFDEQSCFLKLALTQFGSWTYNGYSLDLKLSFDNESDIHSAVDTSEYLENGEWLLIGKPAYRKVKKFSCCPEPYPYVEFYFRIRRRTLYYGFNLIIPSLLISLMTVLGFTLPPDAGEKITLEITILLSVCLFLSIVSDMSPPTSEAVPLIGTFFSCCMLVVSASVVFTVVVLNLHFRTPDTHEMTPFVRSVLLNWLPWLLMMRRPGVKFNMSERLRRRLDKHDEATQAAAAAGGGTRVHAAAAPHGHQLQGVAVHTPSKQQAAATVQLQSQSLLRNVRSLEATARLPVLDASHPSKAAGGGQHLCVTCSGYSPSLHGLVLLLSRVESELSYLTRRMEKEDEDGDMENDWKFAAMVVDRLCLVPVSEPVKCPVKCEMSSKVSNVM